MSLSICSALQTYNIEVKPQGAKKVYRSLGQFHKCADFSKQSI